MRPAHRLSHGPYTRAWSDRSPSHCSSSVSPPQRRPPTHDDFDEGSKVLEGVSRGWPAILSALKAALESGREMDFREADFSCG